MIYGLMVVKNEEDSYLQSCLRWASTFLDGIFVYDDLSLDNSAGVAGQEGAVVSYRTDGVPTFIENEGLFRQASWEAFQERMEPDENDWVLALDADDFYVGSLQTKTIDYEYSAIQDSISHAEYIGRNSISLTYHQVWKNDVGVWTRQDGWWKNDRRPSLFRYRENGTMVRDPKITLATGSWPTYANVDPLYNATYGGVLHYGYAKEEDRQDKYDRYTQKINEGRKFQQHDPKHIRSILENPKLVEWKGNVPKIWTGTK